MTPTSMRLREDSLCLLVEAAEFDGFRRKAGIIGEFGLDIFYDTAQIATLKFSRDVDVLPEVLAIEFQLARFLQHIGDLTELHRLATGSLQRQMLERLNAVGSIWAPSSHGC